MKSTTIGFGRVALLAGAFCLLLSACGGSGGGAPVGIGGGGNNGGGSGGSGSGGPSWTSGVYQPSSQFKNRCRVVRSGLDFEGNPFPDLAGSTLHENFWLRSWTRETYLWNTEVVDRNPANYSNRLQYFDLLRTTAVTPSGKDKDDFHFSQPTDEYLRDRNSAPTASYGASFIAYSTTPPRDFRIQYTQAGSPAATQVMGVANFVRGARILEVDGVDLINANSQSAINTLNNGLFPATAGEMHSFRVQDPGGAPRTVMMISANLAVKAVNRIDVINTGSGKVGYALVNTFSPYASEKEIADAIAAIKAQGVNDLVLDLRYNSGGLLAVAAQLGYMVAGGAQTSGKTFERLRFNAAAGNRDPVTGQINSPVPFYSTGLGFSLANGAPLNSLNLPRVFILTTDETCSASEAVINGLRGVDVEVILIGGLTCGKPYGFYPESNCGETYYTIQFQGVNNKSFGDYADGFAPQNYSDPFAVKAPGCAVADDYNHALGDEDEGLLAAALYYREHGSCPPAMIMSARVALSEAGEDSATPIALLPDRGVMWRNRDLTMPH